MADNSSFYMSCMYTPLEPLCVEQIGWMTLRWWILLWVQAITLLDLSAALVSAALGLVFGEYGPDAISVCFKGSCKGSPWIIIRPNHIKYRSFFRWILHSHGHIKNSSDHENIKVWATNLYQISFLLTHALKSTLRNINMGLIGS